MSKLGGGVRETASRRGRGGNVDGSGNHNDFGLAQAVGETSPSVDELATSFFWGGHWLAVTVHYCFQVNDAFCSWFFFM